MSVAPGTLLATRYQIQHPLGQGAFAKTYLGHDLETGRSVAIKILDPAQAEDWKAFDLFQREAEVLRSLRHHGIPQIFETVRAELNGGAVHGVVMEYIAGESLAAVIESGRRLDRPAVMHFFTEMIGVLDYLHGRMPPILHRDIKPANIILRPDGSPALVDFGSVRNSIRPDGGSTVAGTYGYMPYEQYMGQATPASDLYALAATFLHLVTGTPPHQFMGDTGRIEVPESLPCGEPLAGILVRLLRPAPNERFQSARAVREAIFGTPGGVGLTTAPGVGLRWQSPPVELPAAPRVMVGATKDAFRKVAPTTYRLMNATGKNSEGVDLASGMLIGLFSLLTAGVLPLWFFGLSMSRRKRLKPFFERGLTTQATVLAMELEDIGFGEKLTRVRYQFTVDHRLIRSSDTIMPAIAERWQPGEEVTVLYLPDRDFDSCIISTS